jgi:acyl carrier protein phosphodiesterase
VNHLAHALLATRTGTSIVGNLLGDFVKGRPGDAYRGELLLGIRVHRAVDAFVDGHAAFRRSRDRLPRPLRRWAGVLVDLGYDHVLAARWRDLGEGSLRDFADRVYAELAAARGRLPARMHRFVDYLAGTDLLVAYADPSGLARALRGLSRRVSRANPLGDAAADLVREAAGLEEDLRALLPDVTEAARGAAHGLAAGRANGDARGPGSGVRSGESG